MLFKQEDQVMDDLQFNMTKAATSLPSWQFLHMNKWIHVERCAVPKRWGHCVIASFVPLQEGKGRLPLLLLYAAIYIWPTNPKTHFFIPVPYKYWRCHLWTLLWNLIPSKSSYLASCCFLLNSMQSILKSIGMGCNAFSPCIARSQAGEMRLKELYGEWGQGVGVGGWVAGFQGWWSMCMSGGRGRPRAAFPSLRT